MDKGQNSRVCSDARRRIATGCHWQDTSLTDRAGSVKIRASGGPSTVTADSLINGRPDAVHGGPPTRRAHSGAPRPPCAHKASVDKARAPRSPRREHAQERLDLAEAAGAWPRAVARPLLDAAAARGHGGRPALLRARARTRRPAVGARRASRPRRRRRRTRDDAVELTRRIRRRPRQHRERLAALPGARAASRSSRRVEHGRALVPRQVGLHLDHALPSRRVSRRADDAVGDRAHPRRAPGARPRRPWSPRRRPRARPPRPSG